MKFPLEGVRVLDFTWMNAGAKGTRHLALYGAEVIHLEWKGKLDNMRYAPPSGLVGEMFLPWSCGYNHCEFEKRGDQWHLTLRYRRMVGGDEWGGKVIKSYLKA